MALVVTIGGATSDSYITLAEWQAYWTARGVDLTQVEQDAAHEADLRRAADVIDGTYDFIGMRQYQTQSRDWPRLVSGLVDDWPINPDTIPQAIKDAQAEMAYLIHEGADPYATFTGTVAKAKAGPTEVEYLGGSGRPAYTGVNRILRNYITSGQGQSRMARG